MPKNEGIDLDNILVELGHFGTYQIRTYCYILLPILFSALYNGQYVFNAAAVNYRCVVPECESTPTYEPGAWSTWALPEDGGTCDRFISSDGSCTENSFTNNTVRCEQWVYENGNSIVSEFNLACAEWKRTLVGTIHSVGLFAALPLTGYVSDTFGRKTAFVLTSVMGGIAGIIRSFSTNYYMYLAFEFIEPTLCSGVYSTGFILALEMVGLKRRVLGGNIISMTFALGQVTLGLVAWWLPYWRTLTRVIYAPSLLFVFYWFFVEESVRWLLTKGDYKEASRIIFKAADVNKVKLSPETVKQLNALENQVPSENTSAESMQSKEQKSEPPKRGKESLEAKGKPKKRRSMWYRIVTSKVIMTRLCICSFWWITVTFTYYGLSINSVSLAGNSYVNYILTSLVEIPGYTLSVLTLDRFGRKSSIITAFFVCGCALISLPFVPSSLEWLITSLTMLGKLCISMIFSSIYIYTSELFPTNARHSLLGACSMVGRIGSILAPQTPLLMRYMESLPYLLFGVMAGTSGILMLFTPETLAMRLPDTIEQAENIAVAPRTTHKPDMIVD